MSTRCMDEKEEKRRTDSWGRAVLDGKVVDDGLVILVAQLRLACGDLRKRGLHLGVQYSHDDGHVLVDQGAERAVLELSGEDTCRHDLLEQAQLVLLKHLLDLRGHDVQGVDDLDTALGEGNTVLGQPKSHQQQGNVLRRSITEHGSQESVRTLVGTTPTSGQNRGARHTPRRRESQLLRDRARRQARVIASPARDERQCMMERYVRRPQSVILFTSKLTRPRVEIALHNRGKLELGRLDAARRGNLARRLVAILLAAQAMDVELALRDVGDVTRLVFHDSCCVRGNVDRPSSDMKARD
ncbi:hypothetical protein GGX14DRAFT_393154 [Mycena pura]|uniref:Uncharacterized protein n=1 Tax=Mycena pura TaxID=153505 RepID=A0AAD6VHE2_9AGAR|nr:hypothetical protein GGX14DRAFT_393154 [Mycena pura]